MKVNIYKEKALIENRVDIYCKEETREINDLVRYIHDQEKNFLIGIRNNEQHIIATKDIYYFESVDKKCFAYLEKDIYQMDTNLNELEIDLSEFAFVRVNKSTIVNLYKIDYIKAELNMRVHAYLENGEILIISRHYKKIFQDSIEKLKDRMIGVNNENYQ